ncbi:MAG: hypothetical protein AAFU64_00120 [Bacteroidota bacterium]
MLSKLNRKEQKDKWLELRKTSFVEDLLEARPKDYQERNRPYQKISIFLSYPLQLISILAGSYLLYELLAFAWSAKLDSLEKTFLFAFCGCVFLGIESLRRWLVDTTGYNYFASLKLEEGRVKNGEWLRSNVYILLFLSLILISSGSFGVHQYIKNNGPSAPIIDIQAGAEDIETKIQKEQDRVLKLDQSIQNIQQNKAKDLAKSQSYGSWQNQKFLLPEIKKRHEGYDHQISQLLRQQASHQSRIGQLENRLAQYKSETKQENKQIIRQVISHTEAYAGLSAGIWLGFEFILIFMLAYPWIYLYGSKKEKLLELMDWKKHEVPAQVLSRTSSPAVILPKLVSTKPFSLEKPLAKLDNVLPGHPIGFDKWYEGSSQKKKIKPQKKERKKAVSDKNSNISTGFTIICDYCGKEDIKKRPAKFCSSACRNKAWKERKLVQM